MLLNACFYFSDKSKKIRNRFWIWIDSKLPAPIDFC